MIAYDSKTNLIPSKNNLYLIHPTAKPLNVKEDSDDYETNSTKNQRLTHELKQVELKALRKTASGQIARLYQIANMLTQYDPVSYTSSELKLLKQDIQNAASALEDTLHIITGPFVDDPEPREDEIGD